MGIYDRDYYREEQPGVSIHGPRTVIGWIILINVVIFFADGLLTPRSPSINDFLALHVGDLARPWLWWRFLTYGFAHASFGSYPGAFWHIGLNMLGLFMLGRFVEQHYGQREFLRFYLAAIVASGVIWALAGLLMGAPLTQGVVGASGAVVAVIMLFAVSFPRQTVLLFFVLPMPAWVLGVLIVLGDLNTALRPPTAVNQAPIAWQAHMAGAAFALIYFRGRWNLTRISQNWFSISWFKRRPKLRVHNPQHETPLDDNLADRVDKILEKIHLQGESSLTAKERRMLKDASRQYQKRRRGPDN
jgi:membrane associated rhomboid family serine protease